MKQVLKLGVSAVVVASMMGLAGCKDEDSTVAADAEPVKEEAAELAPESAQQEGATPETPAPEAAPAKDPVVGTPEEIIELELTSNLPQISISQISETPVEGLYLVEINRGEFIHVTADGKHIISGDLMAIMPGGVDNLTNKKREEKQAKLREVGMAEFKKLDDKDLVVFPAQGEEKGEVIAFTDISCGYCVKLHNEVPALNAMGITVKYAAWPRRGVRSPAGQIMANVWCSENRSASMDLAKGGKPRDVPARDEACDLSVLQDQIDLGYKLGVGGTPAIYLTDGRKVGGYRSAAELAGELGVK